MKTVKGVISVFSGVQKGRAKAGVGGSIGNSSCIMSINIV